MTGTLNRTFLAIDYGRRRIGIAKSDPSGLIASPLTTIEVSSRRDAVERLRSLIEEYRPDGLVVGYPRLASGDPGEICGEIDRVLEELRTGYMGPIHLVDEAYTSDDARAVVVAHGKRTGADKKRIDRIAAVIFLQRFLHEGA